MKHQLPAVLETKRLILRPFMENDGDAMFRNWASDPEVTKYLTWPTHTNVEISRTIAGKWALGSGEPGFYQWAIVPKELKEPIGSISCVHTDEATSSVEIGYCIGRKWWGQGFTPEALHALIRFFFEEVGALRVCARHDINNPNSGKVMAKCGMTYEGTLRRSAVNNQGIHDICWYSILREEYKG